MPPPATQLSSSHHHLHLHHAAAPAGPSVPTQLAHFVIFNPTLIPPKRRKRNNDDQSELQPSKPRSLDHDCPASSPSPHVTAPSKVTNAETAGSDGKSTENPESNQNPNPDESDVASNASEAQREPQHGASSSKQSREEDNPDLEDDLREAAQILFYTSHQTGGVSRDMMLRQVGLAKGLMGFTDMAAPSRGEKRQTFWAVHGTQSRMIVYAPLPNWFMYICIKGDETGVNALSDQMLVDGLERGYHDFCLVHGSFDKHEPGHVLVNHLERFFTRFTLFFEKTNLSPPSLLTWLGGQPPSDPALQEKLEALPPPTESTVGLLTRSSDGVVLRASAGTKLDPHVLDALVRYLSPNVTPPPAPPKDEKKAERQALGFGFGRRKESKDLNKEGWTPLAWVGLSAPSSRSATPAKPAHKVTPSGSKRWFGDLGGVFGLGSKPTSPAPDAKQGDEAKKNDEVKTEDDKDDAASVATKSTEPPSKDEEDDTTPTEQPAVTVPTAIPVPGEGPGPMLAVSVSDSVHPAVLNSSVSSSKSAQSSQSAGSTPSVSTIASHMPHAHGAPSVATDMTEVTAAVDPSINASEGTTLVGGTEADAASIRTTRSAAPSMIAKEPPSIAIQDALMSEPDPWISRTLYVPQQAKVRYVVREGAMVFVVEPEAAEAGDETRAVKCADTDSSQSGADTPSALAIDRAALRGVFAALEPPALSAAEEKPKEKPEKLPLGIYHDERAGVTQVRPVPNAEGVALANLREIGTLAAFGQLPSGRFVVRKAEDGAELFVQTPRQGGLTEAERIMRQWSYDCEAI